MFRSPEVPDPRIQEPSDAIIRVTSTATATDGCTKVVLTP
jgi:hypothetical protein